MTTATHAVQLLMPTADRPGATPTTAPVAEPRPAVVDAARRRRRAATCSPGPPASCSPPGRPTRPGRATPTPTSPRCGPRPPSSPRALPPSRGPARGSRLRSAWVLLAEVAPELGEWAGFFAAGAAKRAAAEAGVRGVVTDREADDLVREAETFLALVARTLGVVHQPLLGTTGIAHAS